MTRRKSAVVRPYPPTFVSKATLAYQLDLSDTSVSALVAKGTLPKAKPGLDGIERWWWPEVEAVVRGLVIHDCQEDATADDAFMAGIKKRAALS
jgi:hypothetical protein